ncbi:hypothetical protein EYF80_063564 [Liparis tanakae]|uniref:Uncharacterized protein n=1 Tax=Liparis tanakae TaxID=230148 RepID=A0A4Z2EBV4_9TELE|nr:hypothetical protein EYF80_063564 [Liparis tanakae]
MRDAVFKRYFHHGVALESHRAARRDEFQSLKTLPFWFLYRLFSASGGDGRRRGDVVGEEEEEEEEEEDRERWATVTACHRVHPGEL